MTAEPLPLEEIRLVPGLTPEVAASLAQAASVCFEHQGHASGSLMQVDGDVARGFSVMWNETNERVRRCWADLQEATENGAYGVAAALVPRLTDLTVVERSCKGTGFDYWLGTGDEDAVLFQKRGRLEVTGILKGSDGEISRRTQEKLKQIDRSYRSLTGIVVVVEFGEPRSRVALKWKR